MRKTLLTTAMVLGAALSAPVFAQTYTTTGLSDTGARPGHEPGVGLSEPLSTQASNIPGEDTRPRYAPTLPTPAGGDNASTRTYLNDAAQALNRGRTGEAQEALERAETNLLNNPANPADPTVPRPISDPVQQTVEQARMALGRGDVAGAKQIIGQLLSQTGNSPMGGYPPM